MLLARRIPRPLASGLEPATSPDRAAVGYRADVDGLRALAVVPVVLFHASVPGFGGGFVGVDVFFVISGYLITSIILNDLEIGRFSVLAFYDRRVRRIFPALFAVLLATAVAGLLVLLPADLGGLGRSLAAAALFASNVLFWRESGYFDGAAEQKPLLHTWSLAVEEQFYVVFPLLMFLLLRAGRGRRAHHVAIPALMAFSFALAAWGVERKPEAAFYLAPTRAWELLLGALLATGALAAPNRQGTRDAFSLLGVAMILASVVAFSPATPFPGTAALLPCLGAALVIHAGAGGRSLAGGALSVEPVVLVGLASYSLYLWHWPLLVFARYWTVREPTGAETAAVLLLSALLALASWRFVEQPFRGRRRLLASRPRLFAAAGAATAAALALGLVLHLSGGLPSRLPAEVARLAAGADDRDSQACLVLPSGASRSDDPCRIGAEGAAEPGFVLWGDSHAWALMGALGRAGAESGRAGLVAAHSLCPPLLGVDVSLLPEPGACRRLNAATLAMIARDEEIGTVVLAARWSYYATGALYGREPGGAAYLGEDGAAPGQSAEANGPVFRRGLERTVAALTAAGKRVVVVAPVPEVGLPVPSALARSAWFGRSAAEIEPARVRFEERHRLVMGALVGLEGRPEVSVVYPHAALCDEARCRVEDGGRSLYSDDNHLSLHGQDRVRPLFAGKL